MAINKNESTAEEIAKTVTLLEIARIQGITYGSARSLVSIKKFTVLGKTGREKLYSRADFDKYRADLGIVIVKGLQSDLVRNFLATPVRR